MQSTATGILCRLHLIFTVLLSSTTMISGLLSAWTHVNAALVNECLLHTCWSFTNLRFLKLQKAKSVNIGTAAQEPLARSQPWSIRQGLCRCLPMKGASERLQPLESLIWEVGSGMQPQAWSPGKGHTGNKTGQAWELWKMIPKAEYDHRNCLSNSLLFHGFSLHSSAPKRG